MLEVVMEDSHSFCSATDELKNNFKLALAALNHKEEERVSMEKIPLKFRNDESYAILIISCVGLDVSLWKGFSNNIRKIIGKTLDVETALTNLNASLEKKLFNKDFPNAKVKNTIKV